MSAADNSPGPLPNVPIIDRAGADTMPPSTLVRAPLADRKRVLVVDDEPPILNLLKRILSTENYDIQAAGSGVLAAKLVEDAGFKGIDLLVTDLMMPHMNGRELAAAVRAKYPGTPVLFATGFADNLFTGIHELGPGEAFIEKPFSTSGLLEATRLALFQTIVDKKEEVDKRENEEEWKDERLRTKVVRVLKRWRFA
jgi:DNA-binding response OmpR family regulator